MKKSYRDLLVWQKAIELTSDVYQLTGTYPQNQRYTLCSQTQRSAISIASNIAEGSGRYSDKEFIQFLMIARGSLAELHTQLIIAEKAGFLDSDTLNKLETNIDEIGRMIQGLRISLAKKTKPELISAND